MVALRRARLAGFALCVTLSTLPALGQAPAPQPAVSGDVVVISGKENPELVPEWKAWDSTMIALASEQSRSFVSGPLKGISDSDRAMVKVEITRWSELRQQTRMSAERAARELSADPDKLQERLWSLELEYRFSVLETQEALQRGLSPQGWGMVNDLKNETVASTVFQISKANYARFNLPR